MCQPVTESETPRPEPEYQFMNGESMSTSPEIQVIVSPMPQIPSAWREYRGGGEPEPAPGAGSR